MRRVLKLRRAGRSEFMPPQPELFERKPVDPDAPLWRRLLTRLVHGRPHGGPAMWGKEPK